MTEKCPICKEYMWEWEQHTCKPLFYVWEKEGGATFTDAYDSRSGHKYASDAQRAAEDYFVSDFERTEIEVYVLADKDANEIIDALLDSDQTKEEIERLNGVANELADHYTVTAEVVREVSARLNPKQGENNG